jgi:hypothetical protein
MKQIRRAFQEDACHGLHVVCSHRGGGLFTGMAVCGDAIKHHSRGRRDMGLTWKPVTSTVNSSLEVGCEPMFSCRKENIQGVFRSKMRGRRRKVQVEDVLVMTLGFAVYATFQAGMPLPSQPMRTLAWGGSAAVSRYKRCVFSRRGLCRTPRNFGVRGNGVPPPCSG